MIYFGDEILKKMCSFALAVVFLQQQIPMWFSCYKHLFQQDNKFYYLPVNKQPIRCTFCRGHIHKTGLSHMFETMDFPHVLLPSCIMARQLTSGDGMQFHFGHKTFARIGNVIWLAWSDVKSSMCAETNYNVALNM